MADDPTRYLDVSGVLALKPGATVDVDYTVVHAQSVAARHRELGASIDALADATDRAEAAIWPKGALVDRNLNTLTEPGTYWQSTASLATVERGYPRAGMTMALRVERAASSLVIQEALHFDSTGYLGTWRRTVYTDGRVTDWTPPIGTPSPLGTYVSATNLVHNGDFTKVFEGWNYYGGTASAIPGAVAATGSGAISGVGLYTAPGYRRVAQGGHRVYVEARMRVRTPGATTMRVEFSDGVTRLNAAEVKPPSLDLWTIVRGVTTVPDTFDGRELQVYAAGYWPDRSAASGAVVEIDHVMVIDLTETYGAGVEPNAAEVAARIQELGGFFDGTEPLFAQVGRFIREDEAQALIDARVGGVVDAVTEAIGGHITATNLVPHPTYDAWPSGWGILGGSTPVASAGQVTVTGTGATSGVGVYTATASPFQLAAGHRVYVRVEMSTEGQAQSIGASLYADRHLYLKGAAAGVLSPPPGQRVALSDVLTIPADGAYRLFQQAYFSASTGQKVTAYAPVVLDLTAMYGAGNEPTLQEVEERIARRGVPVLGDPQFDTLAHLATMEAVRDLVPAQPAPAGAVLHAGPPVIFRFDDGFVNNLTLAAPLLAKHGYSGTLYAVTRPAEWAGATMPMMTPAQWKALHDRYGWDIDSHVTAHQDSTVGDPAVWAERLRESCDDIVKAGLPWPRTFAYPNGSRTAATDRYVARLFQVCGLTGHPSKIPVDRHARTFFTGWTTVNGQSPAAGIAQLKSYVRAATARGEVPILGFHGITEGAPPAAHHMSLATLTEIVEWLAAEGYSSMKMGELLPQNLLADPGFEEHTIGQFPWITSGGGWSRTRSTAAGHTGWHGADLLAGGAGLLSQTAPVDPGQTYRVRVRFGAGRTITGGRVDVVAIPQAPTGAPVGPTLTVGTMTGGSTEADVTGLVTVPAGASVLKVGVQPTGFTGSGVRVVHAALYRSDLYDPLA